MACYDVSPYTCTFDSGGAGSLPGGGNPDYSSFATWESDSDNDFSGYTGDIILDCYDSQNHTNTQTIMDGSTNDEAYAGRKVQSSSSCATPFDMTIGTGASFFGNALGYYGFYTSDPYIKFENLNLSINTNNGLAARMIYAGDGTILVKNCVFYDCVNAGAADGYGVGGTYASMLNCIFYDCEYGAWVLTNTNPERNSYSIINCTFGNCSIAGIYESTTATTNGASCSTIRNSVFQSCTVDISFGGSTEAFSPGAGWNASDDTNADLSGFATYYSNSNDLTSLFDADWHPTAAISGDSGSGSQYGKSIYATDNIYLLGKIATNVSFAFAYAGTGYCAMQRTKWWDEGSTLTLFSEYPDYDISSSTRKLKVIRIYCRSYHSVNPRFAIFEGGTSDTDPSGATLVYDFGQSSGSGTDEWIDITIPDGSEPDVSISSNFWIAWKHNGGSNTFGTSRVTSGLGDSCPQPAKNTASQMSADHTASFESTVPTATYGNLYFSDLFPVQMGVIETDSDYGSVGRTYLFPFSDLSLDGIGQQRSIEFDAAWTVGAIEYPQAAGGGADRPQIFLLS